MPVNASLFSIITLAPLSTFELEFNKYYMEVMLPPYMHFRNQLYLEDIIIFNKTTGEFENILDRI